MPTTAPPNILPFRNRPDRFAVNRPSLKSSFHPLGITSFCPSRTLTVSFLLIHVLPSRWNQQHSCILNLIFHPTHLEVSLIVAIDNLGCCRIYHFSLSSIFAVSRCTKRPSHLGLITTYRHKLYCFFRRR